MRAAAEPWRVRRATDGALESAESDDVLAAEEALEIRLDGRPVVVTMRTPGDDAELAIGFLVNEAVIPASAKAEVTTIQNPLDPHRGNIVNVRAGALLRPPAARGFAAASACGVCGLTDLGALERELPKVESSLRASASLLLSLPDRMRDGQALFSRTGGLHAATLFDAAGNLQALREDVGRHNAVDKITGWAQRAGRLPLSDNILLLSGRAGFEVVQKAVASGVPIVCAVGAPSSLAAKMAERANVTLVGFLRGRTFNVYTHAWRIAP